MKLDNEAVASELSAENEPTDVEEISIDRSSKRIFSNNSPSPEQNCENTESEDSDSDSSRTAVDSVTGVSQDSPVCPITAHPKADNNVSGSCHVRKQINETYDRELILHKLVEVQNSSVIDYVLKIERTRKNSKESLGNFDRHGAKNIGTEEEKPEESLQLEFERFRDALQAVPDSMLHLLMGLDRRGDCGRPDDQKPDWLDMEKLHRGQKFADDYMFFISFANMLSLFGTSSFEDGQGPLLFTGQSSTPYVGFKRMLSTGIRFRNWYRMDLWTEGSPARKDMLAVRALHATVNRRMDKSTDEKLYARTKIAGAWCPTRDILLKDFSETCDAPTFAQCPYATVRDNPYRIKGINQMDMAIVQWSFVGLIVCYPESFGIHNVSDEDMDDYCYFWRVVGYQLGVEDEFNFCRGTLDDIRQRSRDMIEGWIKPNFRDITPEFEHVMRCLISGTSAIVPVPCKMYETTLYYLTEMLGLEMPRLYASLSFKDLIIYKAVKFTFGYVIRIPGMKKIFNFCLNKSLDRAVKFTPEELKALRIKLSKGFGNDANAIL